MVDPPKEVIEFLEAGLELTNTESEAGQVVVVPPDDFKLKTIEVGEPDLGYRNANSYLGLGFYPVPIYDVLISSEEYEAAGLLCWLPTFGMFGTVDMDGGFIYRFPESSWEDIVADPGGHIDANWGNHPESIEADFVLPWLHFPYHLDGTKTVVEPYAERCPVHNQEIGETEITESAHMHLLEQREEKVETWRTNYLEIFPCAGMPLDIDRLRCCSQCREQEQAWLDTAAK
ncbi:hypothetical protein N9Y42_05595 [Mariniblastus sp.]|nr:hypothetical protein [Mariniblastus sp.]